MMSAEDSPKNESPTPNAGKEDPHARFIRLFLASEREIFRYVAAIVPSVTDAQDVVQQTAQVLWQKFDQYDPQFPFTPWACRFALLEAKTHLRKSRRWQEFLDDYLAEELVRRRAELSDDFERHFQHLQGCLGKLPSAQRNMVEGYYYRREKIETLAVALGGTAEGIYKSLQRIRRALQDCLTRSMKMEEA